MSACEACAAGLYGHVSGASSSSWCRRCEPGMYSSTGAAACTNCSAGFFESGFSSTACVACGNGKFGTVSGASSATFCTNCGMDYYSLASSSGHTVCDPCSVGKFGPSQGLSVCLNCTAGFFTNHIGSSVCVGCIAGTFASGVGSTSQSNCHNCNIGLFSVGNASKCVQCSEGYFTQQVRTSSCTACPRGSYGATAGANASTLCASCPSGMFSFAGATSCLNCSVGYFADSERSGDCQGCEAGKFSVVVAAQHSSNCVACSSGQFSPLGASECSFCQPGFFAPNWSSESCTPCPAGTHSRYFGSSSQTSCVDCASGMDSVAGSDTCFDTNMSTGGELADASLTESPAFIIGLSGGSAVVVAVIIVVIAVIVRKRNMRMARQKVVQTGGVELADPKPRTMEQIISRFEKCVASIESREKRGKSAWPQIESLVDLKIRFDELAVEEATIDAACEEEQQLLQQQANHNAEKEVDDNGQQPPNSVDVMGANANKRRHKPDECLEVVKRVTQILENAFVTTKSQCDAALQVSDFANAEFYTKRLGLLSKLIRSNAEGNGVEGVGLDTASHQIGGSRESGILECVVPGLLLYKNRFDGDSSAFLGNGTSSAVSRGWAVDVIGSHEHRQVVAVKEIQKTGRKREIEAIREFLLLTKRLGRHRNIIKVLTAKSTGSMIYIVMECCSFSVARMPQRFEEYVHDTKQSMGGSVVLNALVQDLIRGVAFLHAAKVFHCDIKPANVLVSFDRSGKQLFPAQTEETNKHIRSNCKVFKEAQLKVADFGSSRLIEKSTDNNTSTMTLPAAFVPPAAGTTTTATINVDVLSSRDGISGTEAFMCPQLLQIVHDIKAGKCVQDPTIGEELLASNDAFGCGCTLAFLCSTLARSTGTAEPTACRHPFYNPILNSITSNILANRRKAPSHFGVRNGAHVQLIDNLTQASVDSRWQVRFALFHSSVFSSDLNVDGAFVADVESRETPTGSCKQHLLHPKIIEKCPMLREAAELIDDKVAALQRHSSTLPVKLDSNLYVILRQTRGTTVHAYYLVRYLSPELFSQALCVFVNGCCGWACCSGAGHW